MSDDPLRRAVARLVTPHRESLLQRFGTEVRLTRVTQPGLLQQLRAAVIGGTGAHAGGAVGGLDSTRLPFDVGAAGLLEQIETTVAGWTRLLGVEPDVDHPELALVAWYKLEAVEYLAGHIAPSVIGSHVATCRDWAERIEAMFNPPERVPLGAACPVCGNRWAEDRPLEPGQPGDRVDALLVEYQREGHAIGEVRAACRVAGCGAVWTGRAGLEELMAAIGRAEGRLERHVAETLAAAPDTGPVPVCSA